MKSILISGLRCNAAHFRKAPLVCCALALQITTAAAAAAEPHLDPGPMLGHVGPTEMRLWLRDTGPCVPTVRIGEQEDLSDARVVSGDRLASETDFAGTQKFCTNLKLIVPATSLGGVESLAEHRKSVEGPTSPVPDGLVRLSIGIENVNDLIADIAQALDAL